jgi:hypothetical protein
VVLRRDADQENDIQRARHVLLRHTCMVPTCAAREQLDEVPQQLCKIASLTVGCEISGPCRRGLFKGFPQVLARHSYVTSNHPCLQIERLQNEISPAVLSSDAVNRGMNFTRIAWPITKLGMIDPKLKTGSASCDRRVLRCKTGSQECALQRYYLDEPGRMVPIVHPWCTDGRKFHCICGTSETTSTGRDVVAREGVHPDGVIERKRLPPRNPPEVFIYHARVGRITL